MGLAEELAAGANNLYRDSYQMSVGELINIYRDGEMDIHPEFQRLFRWNKYQKVKLIESIMLNIPIPPIFVSQSEDGVWDIIDGVQRLSTIFQFVGELKDEENNIVEPLVLERTDYLPSFEGVVWQSEEDGGVSFNTSQKLFFKRARLDIIIVKKESDPTAKYELFQRLNTGGTTLSPQEVRNCLMIMSSKKFYNFIESLDKNIDFRETIPITDRKSDEQYRMELVLRLLISNNIDWELISEYTDFAQLLDKETLKMTNNEHFDYDDVADKFNRTFSVISQVLGENAFRKYDGSKYKGAFLASAYQLITAGVYNNIDNIMALSNKDIWLRDKVNGIYNDPVYKANITPGVRAIPRFKELSQYGAEYFNCED